MSKQKIEKGNSGKMTKGYELLDSGEGEKLERIGDIVVRRPDPEALWHRGQSHAKWNEADLFFERVDSKTGKWKKNALGTQKGNIADQWIIEQGGLKFLVKPTSFKHIGIFPEQEENWKFIAEAIASVVVGNNDEYNSAQKISVLNLFGYTGGATLAAAKAGMGTNGNTVEVAHVDASKPVVEWAKENAKLNGLTDAPIRWLTDDALAFVKREVKRGKKYDAIVMDPPAFGRGPDGETWKIEENFLELFDACTELLSENPTFFIISGYASGYSALAFKNCLKILEEKFGGTSESLELILKENSSRNASLPAGVTARWKRG